VWTFTKKPIESTSFFTWGRLSPAYLTLDSWLGLPYWILAAVFGVVLAVVVFLLEYFMPYTTELKFLFDQYPRTGVFWADIAWPPYVSGIMVGLLQLPGLTLLTTLIGSSSGFTMFSSMMLYFLREKNEFVKQRIADRINFFQPLYLLAAVLGGTAAAASSSSLHINDGLSLWLSLIGGFLIVFGAQFAGGCTSGHGISGMHVLSVASMLATASMFAGGIVAAYVLLYSGAYGNTLVVWPRS